MNKNRFVFFLGACCVVLLVVVLGKIFLNNHGKTKDLLLIYGDKQVNYTIDINSLYNNLPIETIDGFQFVGWALDSEGKNMVELTSVLGSEKTLYAIYAKASYPLKFILNGSKYKDYSSDFVMNVLYEDTVELDVPKLDGYTFMSWEVMGKKSSVENNVFKMGVEASTLRAMFAPNKYNIVINYNGGSYEGNSSDTVSLDYNSYLDLPTPVRDGYIFSGYEMSSGKIANGHFVFTKPVDVNITAKWVINNSSTKPSSSKTLVIENDKKADVSIGSDSKADVDVNPITPSVDPVVEPIVDPNTQPISETEPILEPSPESEKKEKDSADETSSVTVYYYLMSSDGNDYVLDRVVSEKVKKNTKYTANVISYDNFISPEKVTIDVADKKNYEITYKYNRKKLELL